MNRALIVRLGSLGDVVHAIPAAAALRRAYPAAQIDWVTHPTYLSLVGLVEGVDEVIGVDTRSWRPGVPGNVTGTLARLRRTAYDVVLDLQGLLKSAALARAVGGRRTVGFAPPSLREPSARFLYTETVDVSGAVHVIEQNLAACAALGVADPTIRFPVRIPPSTAVDGLVRDSRDGFALLNAGAAWPNKRWPPERFGAVAEVLQRDLRLPSVVMWGPGERSLAASVVAASSGAARLAPTMTIPDLVALVRAARVMVSGDTGPLHLATAVGTPVVGLFGPTRAERNGPWASDDISVSRTAGCECLYERRCRRASACIDEIGVAEVVAGVSRRGRSDG